MSQFSHLDEQGHARMVDVSSRAETLREARATASIRLQPATLEQLVTGKLPKGDAFAVARLAGIQAAKRCSELVPLCHPLALSVVELDFAPQPERGELVISSLCRLRGRTGVEMEALTAVMVAALALYDMCKSVDPGGVITDVRLLSKRGGRSGDWVSASGTDA